MAIKFKNKGLQTTAQKIRQRRSQMLVHSYLYYVRDTPIVSDEVWQRWANQLVKLHQRKTEIGFYDEEFLDWDGSTGHHLPSPAWVRQKASMLLDLRGEHAA